MNKRRRLLELYPHLPLDLRLHLLAAACLRSWPFRERRRLRGYRFIGDRRKTPAQWALLATLSAGFYFPILLFFAR